MKDVKSRGKTQRDVAVVRGLNAGEAMKNVVCFHFHDIAGLGPF